MAFIIHREDCRGARSCECPSYANVNEAAARLAELDAQYAGRTMPQGAAAEWNRLNETVEELRVREARLRELAGNPRALARASEAGATFEHRARPSRHEPEGPEGQSRDEAMRVIERFSAEGTLDARAADRLDQHVREDKLGLDAALMTAVADRDYLDAFGILLGAGPMAFNRMTREQVEAVQRVNQAQQMRAMSIGTPGSGGFAVPFTLDASLMNISNGALCPIREVCRQVTISGSTEWRGVTSTSPTSKYDVEAAEASDDSPTLAQPVIKAERWDSFIPFTYELGQDWGALSQELAQLMADSKDQLDSQKMLTGTGTNEPKGVLVAATTVVTGAGTGTFAVADVYAVKQNLPSRFQPGASWLLSGTHIDNVWRMVPAGSTIEATLMTPDRQSILGKRVREWSSMSVSSASGQLIAIYGALESYVIVDRLFHEVELIPNLFGTNRRPTGQRGLFAVGRTGAGVTVVNGIRVLKVK